jgi:transposase-like protein
MWRRGAAAAVGDILIAVVDGLKGFPEAINAVFPQTIVQTCIDLSVERRRRGPSSARRV